MKSLARHSKQLKSPIMKNTILFLLLISIITSCANDEFNEPEDLQAAIEAKIAEKQAALIEGKDCWVCDYAATTPEVIFCANGVNSVLQVSNGTTVVLDNITLTEQLGKASLSATCTQLP